jgi:hypothetical protein
MPHKEPLPETKLDDRRLIKYFAASVIFCPFTGAVLDYRKTIVVCSTTGKNFVVCAEQWDKVKDDVLYAFETAPAFAGHTYTILDGRELWKNA